MRAAIFSGPGAVEVGERPDPVIQEPTDAVVRVMLGYVCRSDLWYYLGESPHAAGSIGHEFSVITVLLPFIGYPRTLNALAAINEIAPASANGTAGA